MTTMVTLTGAGQPYPAAGRADAGTLVRCGETVLQLDTGCATMLRLAEIEVTPAALNAVLLTHVHSDHVIDLPDVAMVRWDKEFPAGPLPVVAPRDAAARYVSRMFEPFADDILKLNLWGRVV
ncbi:MBL fold metallo-hydrolase [Streptomyces sp. NPDC048291]|uniref:MBL fold metallo-hydrolase n=1 Tax=Streptomyces sp. NPDC048291 TaxID=3365530 RepID=UPI003720F0B7